MRRHVPRSRRLLCRRLRYPQPRPRGGGIPRGTRRGHSGQALEAQNAEFSMNDIECIRDRVIQTAAKIVIEPIFEADFEDNAYGYRPARGAVDAVKEVHRHLCRGYADVVDADLSRYFDTIPHSELSVARRVVDRNVLRLIKMWLRAPIEERDADGTRR